MHCNSCKLQAACGAIGGSHQSNLVMQAHMHDAVTYVSIHSNPLWHSTVLLSVVDMQLLYAPFHKLVVIVLAVVIAAADASTST